MPPIIEAISLALTYSGQGRGFLGRRNKVRAVDDVSFAIAAGEAFGLVGESGCGKTSVGRLLSAAVPPSQGEVLLKGERFVEPMPSARRAEVQVIFQDTLGALNPRLTIGRQMNEPLIIHKVTDGSERKQRIATTLDAVGLSSNILDLYPQEISGGQRQRIVLARALLLRPNVLLCDEAVSALDVSVQAHVVNLIAALKEERQLACLFISHDLRIVSHLCERIGVMYLGRLIEVGACASLFAAPGHPYTRALLGSLPADQPKQRRQKIRLAGEPPSALEPPSGCGFQPRCPFAVDECHMHVPQLRLSNGHLVACHRAAEI